MAADAGEQIKELVGPKFQRKDIGLLGIVLIVICVIQLIIGFVLIAYAIALPNDKQTIYYILQWTFAFLAVCFPWFGIFGAYKSNASALICFALYCIAQIAWNIVYIIGLGIVGPATNHLVPEIIFAGIEIGLGVILFAISALLSLLILHFYHQRNSEM